MRNSIITAYFALVMCISGAAQTVVEAEGFFDTDPGVGNGITLSTVTGSVSDISGSLPLGVTSGFHTFYVRCKASTNLWSNARGRIVYVTNEAYQLPEVQEVVACEYFIDSDPGVGNGTAVAVAASPTLASIAANVATAQAPGVHQVGVRFRASNGYWSNTRYRSFLVRSPNDVPVAEAIVDAEYFFDTDPGVGNGTPIAIDTPGLTVDLAASDAINLSVGMHQVYVRCKSNLGYWSNPRARTLLVTESALLPSVHYIDAAEYYIDSDPGLGNGTSIAVPTATTVNIAELIDASTVSVGVHQLYIRVRSDLNVWSDFAVQSFTVSSDTQPVFVLQALNPLCAGSNTGTIEVSTIGGTPPFFYAWDGTVGNDTLFNASEGPHQLIVTDATSTVVLDTTITLVAPADITYQLTSTEVSCFGESDGTVTLVAEGGVGDFIYDWNGVDTAQLQAGVYQFTITDANGCDVSGSVTISQPDQLEANTTTTVATFGECDGTAEVTVTGGTAPFVFVWMDSNEQIIGSDPSVSNLCTGIYTVEISDAQGCMVQAEASVLVNAIDESLNSGIQITVSPNPSNGIFKVKVDALFAGYVIWSVTDAQGRIVDQSSTSSSNAATSSFDIDLTTRAAGLYHLRIGIDDHYFTHQLVRE